MGQVADAMGNATTFAPDPSDFSGSEWAARLLGGGIKGLGQGMQNYQQQNSAMRQGGGGGFQVPMTQQPQVQLPMGTQGPGTGDQSSTRARNPYFFGAGV